MVQEHIQNRFLAGLLGVLGVCAIMLIVPTHGAALSGSEFRSGNIIDDGTFFNGNAMSASEIQNFMISKVPFCDTNGAKSHSSGTSRANYGTSKGSPPPYTCLKDYRQDTPSKPAESGLCGAYSGGNRSAAEIIYEVGRSCGVSQKALVVLLQKEQSLITDDWPWPIQYRSATGYGCPDTAPCDAEYYGFFNQVYNAARQFKKYGRDSGSYNHRVGRTSYVQYNPNAGCGGSNVLMQNRATAALYNYTPYQPNQAALNNLYGTGDSCSAYGNRNFWRMYNDWFGSSASDGFTYAVTDDGSGAQYVLYSGVKQYVPNTQVQKAWGLDKLTPITYPASYLASITTGPHLNRFTRLNNESTIYFLDSGRRYRMPWGVMVGPWNVGNLVPAKASYGLFSVPIDGGDLSYTIKPTSSNTIYMLDGADGQGRTVLRPYQNIDVFRAWEGVDAHYVTVSDEFFDEVNDAIGSTLTNTKVVAGDAQYQILNSYRLWQTSLVSSIYSGTAQTVSWATIGRLSVGPNITQVIKSPSSPYYLVDNGVRRPLSSFATNAWSTPTQDITIVNNSFLNLIPQGSDQNGYMAENNGQLYILNRRKVPVPQSLKTAYTNTGQVTTVSNQLINLYPTVDQAKEYLKSNDSNSIYKVESTGQKRLVTQNPHLYSYTELSFYIVNAIATGQNL